MPLSSILTRPDDALLDQLGEVEALSRAIRPRPLSGERLEARYITPHGEVERRFYPDDATYTRDLPAWIGRYHCYAGVALRRGGGTAAHCSRTMTLHGDFDAKIYADTPDPMAAALQALRSFPLTPTAVVNTVGGFHGYWALTEPVDLQDRAQRDRVQALNRAMARAVCGPERKPDAVHDVTRVLRQPATLNHKYDPPGQTSLLWCDPARRYSLDDSAAYLAAYHSWIMDESHPAQTHATAHSGGSDTSGEGVRPGDDFNRRGDIRPLLHKHGWRYLYKRGAQEYWQRPGKSGRGTSATFNHDASGLLYVFTSDGAPFEPLKAYSPFAVYALLERRGDYVAAAKALAADGYGDQHPSRAEADAELGSAAPLVVPSRSPGVPLPSALRRAGVPLPQAARVAGVCL